MLECHLLLLLLLIFCSLVFGLAMHSIGLCFLIVNFNFFLLLHIAGNIRSALKLTNELLELLPTHERANGNKVFYEKELAREDELKADKMLRGDDGSPDFDQNLDPNAEKPYTSVYNTYERRTYEQLCRNEIGPEPQVLARLKCRFVTNKSAFLKIAPLKLEEASLTPYIVIYHDVLYDQEIELIKQMAKPRVSRYFGSIYRLRFTLSCSFFSFDVQPCKITKPAH